MKRIYLAILAAAALLTSCEEFQPVFTGKYEDPQAQKVYTDADFNTITSIAELKDLYAQCGHKPITLTKDIVISGKVTTSDQVGNLYKSLYIQDETAGIEIKIGKNGLYNEYKLGQKLYISCTELTLGDYNGMINLGFSDFDKEYIESNNVKPEVFPGIGYHLPFKEYETSYLEHANIIDNHVFKGEIADPVKPVEVLESELHSKVNLGRLVTIKDLKYDGHIFLLAYVDPNGNRKDNNNRIFIDEEGPDNYGVTTWACSESKWKEYLNAGNFDAVEAPAGTVADYKNADGTYDIGSMAYSVSQYFKMGNTEVQVRSSGYARFADTELPREVLDGEATVTLTGILTDYKGAAQFTLIDLDGVAKADGTLWY